MKRIKMFYEARLITHNIKPYKVIKLDNNKVAEHYVNGNIKIVDNELG